MQVQLLQRVSRWWLPSRWSKPVSQEHWRVLLVQPLLAAAMMMRLQALTLTMRRLRRADEAQAPQPWP